MEDDSKHNKKIVLPNKTDYHQNRWYEVLDSEHSIYPLSSKGCEIFKRGLEVGVGKNSKNDMGFTIKVWFEILM